MSDIRILFLRGGAIGDFIMTLPALAALRQRWPDAYIELAGYPRTARLAWNAGIINRFVSLDNAGMAGFFSYRPKIPAEQAAYLKLFDLVVSYLYDPDEILALNMRMAGVKNFVRGDPMVKDIHAVEYLFKPLAELAIYPEGAEYPVLPVTPDQAERGRQIIKTDRPVLLLHPGSGSLRKNWPLENFAALAEAVAESGELSPVFLFGEADDAVRSAYAAAEYAWPCREGLDLTQVCDLISACRAFAGNDSGITHLAAAAGIPTVAVYGPSDHTSWGLRGPHTARVFRERSADGAWDGIWPAVAEVKTRLDTLMTKCGGSAGGL